MNRLLLLLIPVLLFAGCGEDEPGTPPSPAPFDLPESPQALMDAFRTTYETMDADLYDSLLDPGFETILQQDTVNQFPDVGQTLDFAEEERIAGRLFSREDLTDPDGAFVPGVKTITFQLFTPTADWSMSPPDDPIPATLFAPYEVQFLFDRGQEYSLIHVHGGIRFYAAARDSLHQGVTRTYYRMVGQVDQTWVGAKSVEDETWGSLKALYR